MEHRILDRSEWDFAYLDDHKHLKRCAVLYEYGRQNQELQHWILDLRKSKMFKSSKEYLSIDQIIRDKTNARILRESAVISFTEVQFLVSLDEFPAIPFRATLKHLNVELCKHVNGGAISNPAIYLQEIPDGIWHRANTPPIILDQPSNIERSVHIFSIPWKDTSNDQLASQFRTWLDAHRPKRFLRSKKLGRNSGPSDGANHKLNQLGAFRLHQAGFSKEEALDAGFLYYGSERDWERAITEAAARIKQVYKPEPE